MLCGVTTGVANLRPLFDGSASSDKPALRTVFRRQPRWVLSALGAILVLALVLYSWNIGYSGLSTYYAASVRSMLENPRAVFFGALDPGATVTLDKLAGFLVPQALSASIFGFHAWALSLPQVVEGLVTILASYVIGTRWRGPALGLAIAAVMAVTPMLAAMFGRPMEDGMLTMCMVLSFAAWQRALIQRSVVWLSVSGLWIAVGFQAKMLQAWLILPALLIAYLICAAVPVRRRIWHLAVAGAVTLVLSLSWMTAIQLVPAGQRPFIDGTTSNNTYSMVFGYNGVDRLIPGLIPGAVPQLNSSPGSGQSPTSTTATSVASTSPLKLFLPQFTTQMGWFYPAAAAGAVFEALVFRRRFVWRRSIPIRAGPTRLRNESAVALALILWSLITGLVMSFAFVPHATYLAVLTLPLTALAVVGAVRAAEVYRAGGRAWVVLPALVVAQTLWAASIALMAAVQLRGLAPAILVVGLASSGVLVWLHLHRPTRSSVAKGALAGALAAALIGPVVWSLCVLGPGGGGSASDAFAGPRIAAPVAHPVNTAITAGAGLHLRPPFSVPRVSGLDAAQRRLLGYVNARNRRGSIPFATDTMAIAVSVILATHEAPIPMGGFSQHAPSPTLAQLQHYIGSGRLRFVLLSQYPATRPAPSNAAVESDRAWVHTHCAAVLAGRFRDGKTARQVLYDCVAAGTKPGLSRATSIDRGRARDRVRPELAAREQVQRWSPGV
jgi:4-amino-4-deoxy-L-arabinose transferase-like glycosyltransferase